MDGGWDYMHGECEVELEAMLETTVVLAIARR